MSTYKRPEPRISRATGNILYSLLEGDTIVAYWNEKEQAVRYWNDTKDMRTDTNVVRAGIIKGVLMHKATEMTRSQRVPVIATDVGRTVQQRRWPRLAG